MYSRPTSAQAPCFPAKLYHYVFCLRVKFLIHWLITIYNAFTNSLEQMNTRELITKGWVRSFQLLEMRQHKCRVRSDQPFSEVLPTEDGDLFLANDHDTVTGITSKQKFTIWNDIYRDSVLRYTIQIRARPNDKLHRRLNIDAHLSAIEPVRVLYGTVGGRN